MCFQCGTSVLHYYNLVSKIINVSFYILFFIYFGNLSQSKYLRSLSCVEPQMSPAGLVLWSYRGTTISSLTGQWKGACGNILDSKCGGATNDEWFYQFLLNWVSFHLCGSLDHHALDLLEKMLILDPAQVWIGRLLSSPINLLLLCSIPCRSY